MGVWEGWMRTGAYKQERGTWLHANVLGGGQVSLGLKGATIVAALKWRFPSRTWFFGRGPRPIQPQASVPQGWGTFLMPMWDGRYGLPKCEAGKFWNPLPAVWAANPQRRLVYFEGQDHQGSDHTVAVTWRGQVVDNSNPLPPPESHLSDVIDLLAARLSRVTDVWYAALRDAALVAASDDPAGLHRVGVQDRHVWQIVRTWCDRWAGGRY